MPRPCDELVGSLHDCCAIEKNYEKWTESLDWYFDNYSKSTVVTPGGGMIMYILSHIPLLVGSIATTVYLAAIGKLF